MFNIAIHFIVPLLFLIAPASIAAHEIGHLLGARIVKADVFELSIGRGKSLVSFSSKSLKINVRAFYFIGGEAKSKRKQPYKPLDIFLITIGGPLLNLLCAYLFYMLHTAYPSEFLGLIILFNLWLGLVNLIPLKMSGKSSDGYVIFQAILKCVKIR